MPNNAPSHSRMLDLWIEALCAELQELFGAPPTVVPTTGTPQAASAYRTMLLVEGPARGAMYITTSAASMVQFAQMAVGEQVDAHAAWTEERLESWRRLLETTAARLSIRLTEEFPNPEGARCTILLAETTAVDGTDVTAISGNDAAGSTMQQWLLHVGQAELAVSASIKVEFPAQESQVPIAQAAEAVATLQAQDSVDDRIEDLVEEAAPDEPASSGVSGEELSRSARQSAHTTETQTGNRGRVQQPDLVDANASHEQKQRLDLLLDIELEATLRFGALELPLREVLELGPGDVLPLDRHVREPVDLVVGDRIVARGEVVLVGGNFGLHVTEVAEPRRRLETIRCLF